MSTVILPSPLCYFLSGLEIDSGTLCLAQSPIPGSVGLHPLKVIRKGRKTHKHPHAQAVRGAGSLSKADFEAAAKALGSDVDANLLHAFAIVESGGRSGFSAPGLPIIAYEGHVFRKKTHKKYDEDYPLLSYPYVKKAGPEWKKNNKDQTTAWKTLNDAIALDESAALEATSWGMFQVMGFNYKSCGYNDVKAFVTAMKASERSQLDAFVGYCKKKAGMVEAMRNKDFATMAELYNGEDYGDYDDRIRKAYNKLQEGK